MMPEFKRLLMSKAKEGKFLSEDDKKAKMEVLDGIKQIMAEAMGQDMKGLKKVTVASPTEEGLKEGLKVAEDKLEGEDEEEDSEEEACPNCEDGSCPECKMKGMMDEGEMEPSKEEKIKKLEAELAMLKGE